MKRPVKFGVASLKALLTFVVLGAAAHASLPYLPLIGPAPLRVLAAHKPSAASLTFELAAAAQTNANQAVTESTNQADTNTLAKLAASSAPTVVMENPDDSLGDSFTSSVFTIPAPDLLGITPQMLSTYFHPVMFGTNGPVPMGPYRVSFMPPLPPDKSSHAEYIIK